MELLRRATLFFERQRCATERARYVRARPPHPAPSPSSPQIIRACPETAAPGRISVWSGSSRPGRMLERRGRRKGPIPHGEEYSHAGRERCGRVVGDEQRVRGQVRLLRSVDYLEDAMSSSPHRRISSLAASHGMRPRGHTGDFPHERIPALHSCDSTAVFLRSGELLQPKPQVVSSTSKSWRWFRSEHAISAQTQRNVRVVEVRRISWQEN